MTREIRRAIARAIEDSDLQGYKWTITPNGLKWSYGEEFTFDTSHENILKVNAPYWTMAIVWYESGEELADCETLEDAYYLATLRTIRKANYEY